MTVCLDFLAETSPARIVRAFNSAFGDYAIKMDDRDETWLVNRMKKNAVDYSCSVGAFAGDDLVGFSLTGIDDVRGVPTAYDAATGIVPGYRGQGLAARMFDHALPRLRERGIQTFLLEVLQVNEPAIKAYQRVGFEVTREFDCYSWLPGNTACTDRPLDLEIEIRPVAAERTVELAADLDYEPSWEVSLAAVGRIPDKVISLGAFADNQLIGTVVYYPLLKWIVNLVVRREARRKGIGTSLLCELKRQLPLGHEKVTLPNVERGRGGSGDFLLANGFDLEISQFEMAMNLAQK
jgi:ribosomal protein S18 acetylase RimI-like enzyme